MERCPVLRMAVWIIIVVLLFSLPPLLSAEEQDSPEEKLIALDFNNVDLPIFIKFVSELTEKNFVIDERVKGKITIFAPSPISVDRTYEIFQSVIELKGFTLVPTGSGGEIYQVMPSNAVAPERAIQVYHLKNTNAEDMAKVILGLVSRVPRKARKGKSAAGGISGRVQVLADKNTNSLVITASNRDFEVLKSVIQQLDVKRKQVYVEAVILEVSLNKFRDIGTDLRAAFGQRAFDNNLTVFGGINANPTEFSNLASVVPGLAASPVNVLALLRFLQSSSDVNILSTPHLLASDNQKAEITVGQNVPFPGSQSQTVGGNVQTTIQRRDVGVILRLTPQVLENDLIKLDVYQEISSLVDTAQVVQDVVLGPTTNKRTAATIVVAKSGHPVVIGGLIRDNLIKSETKIPLLGDIPLIGFLFRSTKYSSEKTNLLIFLTPYLIRDVQDLEPLKAKRIQQMDAFLEEKQDELKEIRQMVLQSMINFPGEMEQ